MTKDYLLEDVTVQAKKIANEYINCINNMEDKKILLVSEYLNEIEIFLKTYDVEEIKFKLLMTIGRKFENIKQYKKAFIYYLKAYESAVYQYDITESLEMIAKCCLELKMYEEANNYYLILLELNDDSNVEYHCKFNMAVCYLKLEKFEEVLKSADELLITYEDMISKSIEEYIKINLLIGLSFLKLNLFNKAIDVYNKLLKLIRISRDEKEELNVLLHLANIYYSIKDFSKLKNICFKILGKAKLNTNFINEYEGHLYIELAKNIRSIDDEKSAIKLLMDILKVFKNGQASFNLGDIEDTFSELLDIYFKNTDVDGIDYVTNELFELIKKQIFPKENRTILKLINYYNDIKAKDKISSIIEFLSND